MWCRNVAAGSLTDRRSVALSPVDGRHVPGHCRASQISEWTSKASSEPGGNSAAPRVHQQSIQTTDKHHAPPVILSKDRSQLMIGLFRCLRFRAVRMAWIRVLIIGCWSRSTHFGGVHSGIPSVLILQVQPRARKL